MDFNGLGMVDKDGRPQPALPRLPSVYSLTFDEFHSAVGGPGRAFGSMNMDELVRSIWTAEEAHAAPAMVDFGGYDGSGLQRQGSITLPRTISQKTVDEVWRDLFGESSAATVNTQLSTGCGVNLQSHQRQTTLGDTTLEEFLLRAGVVIESPPATTGPVLTGAGAGASNVDLLSRETGSRMDLDLGLSRMGGSAVASAAENCVANFSIAGLKPSYSPNLRLACENTGYTRCQGIDGNRSLDFGRETANGDAAASAVGLGLSSIGVAATRIPNNLVSPDAGQRSKDAVPSISQIPYAFTTGLGRKRGVSEKFVERRQRRMIKNRESAAKSRARKQAYTLELEAEVMKLKDRNQELQKKQAEILEWQKNQILGINRHESEPKRPRLTRACTGPW